MSRTVAESIAAISRLAAVPTILEVVARTTGMRFTAVAHANESSWTACAVYDQIELGLQPGSELKLEATIGEEIRQHRQPAVFGHASADERFRDHPAPKQDRFESCLAIPILLRSGELFGALCALDPRPARLDDPNLIKTLELFAQLIAEQLDASERIEESDTLLDRAHEAARLREQFIAVLGHDLRQPLHAIKMGTEIVAKVVLDDRAQRALKNIHRSVGRMNELIQNILDFARGRLGGGIPVALQADEQLGDELRHVVIEVMSSHPERDIDASINIKGAVTCDRSRIAQLLANLLTNALTHSPDDQPIRVEARNLDQTFELAVKNGGPPIPEDKLPRLFLPFSRQTDSPSDHGLGLGLFIASEIAKGHEGTLEVTSSLENGTRFLFRMPRHGAPAGW